MTDYGHSKVSRKAFLPLEQGGDPFWNESRVFNRWEAWEYLFSVAARYGEQTWLLRSGQMIDLERGETKPLSIRYLETRWRWGKNRVHRFLATLVQMDRISVHQRTTDGDTYLVVNYELYQGWRDSDGTATGTEAGRRRDSGGTKEKQVKQEKQVKTEGTLSGSVAASGNGRPSSSAWMWDAWQAEFGEDLPARQYTEQRRKKFKAFYEEHLKGRADAKQAFRQMLAGIRDHEFWGDKPNTWLPEVCMRSAEKREDIALGERSGRSSGSGTGLDINLNPEFYE